MSSRTVRVAKNKLNKKIQQARLKSVVQPPRKPVSVGTVGHVDQGVVCRPSGLSNCMAMAQGIQVKMPMRIPTAVAERGNINKAGLKGAGITEITISNTRDLKKELGVTMVAAEEPVKSIFNLSGDEKLKIMERYKKRSGYAKLGQGMLDNDPVYLERGIKFAQKMGITLSDGIPNLLD